MFRVFVDACVVCVCMFVCVCKRCSSSSPSIPSRYEWSIKCKEIIVVVAVICMVIVVIVVVNIIIVVVVVVVVVVIIVIVFISVVFVESLAMLDMIVNQFPLSHSR